MVCQYIQGRRLFRDPWQNRLPEDCFRTGGRQDGPASFKTRVPDTPRIGMCLTVYFEVAFVLWKMRSRYRVAWDQDQRSDMPAKVACQYLFWTTSCCYGDSPIASSGRSQHASLLSCTAFFLPFSYSSSSGFYENPCCCYCKLLLEGVETSASLLLTNTKPLSDAS